MVEEKKKVNILGDAGVGKTSLIIRFVKQVFGDEYLKTIGTNIYTKKIDMEGGTIKLVIQDIMGEKAYHTVREGAFKGSTGAIAVADITRPDSLDSLLNEWIPKYQKTSSDSNPIILAVNKFDLPEKRITPDRLRTNSHFFDMSFYTSAKTGRNVETAFKILSSKVSENLQLSIEDVVDVVSEKKIETPRKLLDALLAYASELGNIPYESRERMLADSGIEKFDLEEEIKDLEEEEVLRFAEKVKDWYDESEDDYSFEAVERLLAQYNER